MQHTRSSTVVWYLGWSKGSGWAGGETDRLTDIQRDDRQIDRTFNYVLILC